MSETGVSTGAALPGNGRILLTTEQIQKRVCDVARQVSDDYQGRALSLVGVLESGFIFMADLVRALEVPVTCQFVKPELREVQPGSVEIFYAPEVDVRGANVLLVEAVVQSGVTTEFLMRNLMARGAASVKLLALLDKQAARRVALQPDYFGFLIEDTFVFGYGLGTPDFGRNLPYIVSSDTPPPSRSQSEAEY